MAKAGCDSCKLSLKTAGGDDREEEATGNLAAANEISTDDAVAALLSEPSGIFKDVLGGKDVFASLQQGSRYTGAVTCI